MLDFSLRQLGHFVAVAEAGSYREAAERLFVAQPALSISINKLEQALGVRLFHRGPKGVSLTPGGEAFLVEARRSLQHAEQARQHARLADLGEWGTVRLGFVGSAAYGLLPRTLPGFLARYPDVKLELLEGTTAGMLPMLREGRLDAGVIRTPLDDPQGITTVDVEADTLVAVLPASHPLAGRKRLALSSLRDEAFVMFSRTHVPGLRAAVVQACREAGFTPRVGQEATQALTVVGLVGSGLGVSLVPGVIANFSHARTRFVPLLRSTAASRLMLSLATPQAGSSAATLRLRAVMAELSGMARPADKRGKGTA